VTTDERYMQRCIELARLGKGSVSPNPLVGAVVVYENVIIGEGWHKQFGSPHAEVNAINAVKDQSLLSQSTVYVNLEPCSHFGKTPPCADLLIKHKVKRVVVGMEDPFSLVAGRGIAKLRDAGIEVEVGTLGKECKELNKRFITFHQEERPYIILKWAQTIDGFIAPDAAEMSAEEFEQKRHITGHVVQKLVHKWRTEEDAILVGKNTMLTDNPALNARAWQGRNPLRITIDQRGELPHTLKLFDGTQPSLVFTGNSSLHAPNEFVQYAVIDFTNPIWPQIAGELYKRNVQSLIIEGGAITLTNIIQSGIWDEAQVFTAPQTLQSGVAAPVISGALKQQFSIDGKQLHIYRNI
jgi:diaminohydroxyphosphoribosylaminopyrimidine deaminase/5-amino-6-(5-phosphoribosylamino)uracil reductase